jgi:hypothetical protein
METLYLEQTELTALVIFNPGRCELRIEGKMIPEDVAAAFLPIKNWVEKYLEMNTALHFLFRLYYYNTSSARQFYLLFKKMNEHYKAGKEISVRWEYEDGDEDSKSDAEEFLSGVDFKYEIVSVSE